MAPAVVQHLDAAARNLTIARDLLNHVPDGLEHPAYEWVVVASFYSAVRSLNTYLRFSGRPDPRSHAIRNRELYANAHLESVRDQYVELLNWSRDARYSYSHELFDEYRARIAIDDAIVIDDHIRSTLHSS